MPLLHGPIKRAIIERIRSLDLVDDEGLPVQVESTLPQNPERLCVYPGAPRWTLSEPVAERSLMTQQVITLPFRIRVELPGGGVEEAERVAEALQARIAAGVVAEPYLLANAGSLLATSGDSDPTVLAPDPDSRVIVNLGLVFTATVVTTAGV